MNTPRNFQSALANAGLRPLRRAAVSWLQVNLGRKCNQACTHCHVDASPARTEMMDAKTVDRVLQILEENPGIGQIDLTGGAPELNVHFKRMVQRARSLDRRVIDRCNLTILSEPGQEELAEFLAEHKVEVVASLPCYTQDNVDKQRGKGVFARSIDGLRRLNGLGYGQPGTGLKLDLVYNPGGAFLPGPQAALQADYKSRLMDEHGIVFNELLTITNMPIKRFARDLARQGKAQEYMDLLLQAFNPATVEGLMCRHLVSVDWQGKLYDCDFNQMLEMPIPGRERTIWELEVGALDGAAVAVDDHCFGCTAGAGSSCGGALA